MTQAPVQESVIVKELYEDIVSMFRSQDESVNIALRYVLDQHGKGTRPIFMLLMAELAGGTWDTVKPAAMLVEAIHIASLLHDDVLDESAIRRGVEALHVKYSDKVSVLSGDYIFIKALNIASRTYANDVVRILFRAVERMTLGEIRDTIVPEAVDENTYLSIIADKTASLFAASAEIAVSLSGDGSRCDTGREIGEKLGMAFQIIDDTLDYMGDETDMGKPGLQDAGTGRMTLPLIHALDGVDDGIAHRITNELVSDPQEVRDLVEKRGGIEYAFETAGVYTRRAQELIDIFENEPAGVSLKLFIDRLLERCC